MIKINLLPSYILERVRIRRVVWWIVGLLVIELLAFGFAALRIKSEVAAAEERLGYWQKEAGKVTAVTTLTGQVKSNTTPYVTWLNWFTGLERHNVLLANYLQGVSTFIYRRVQITNLSLDNSRSLVTIIGKTDSLESLSRYYLNMLRGPFTQVVLSTTITGWNLAGAPPLSPRPGPGGLPYSQYLTLPVTLTCTMAAPIVAPPPPVAAQTLTGTTPPGAAPAGAPAGTPSGTPSATPASDWD